MATSANLNLIGFNEFRGLGHCLLFNEFEGWKCSEIIYAFYSSKVTCVRNEFYSKLDTTLTCRTQLPILPLT